MQVRPMTLDDLDRVVVLEAEIFDDAWSYSSFEIEITRNKYSIPIVLESEKNIIGYAILWKIFDEFHIANIAVQPEFQGKKLGQLLFEASLKKAENCRYAYLEVRENNEKAIRLYQKYGFVTILKRAYYYKNGETALVMRKKLV